MTVGVMGMSKPPSGNVDRRKLMSQTVASMMPTYSNVEQQLQNNPYHI